MANIPVEKRAAGMPWWAWLLGLLALLLVGTLLLRGCNNDADTTTVVDRDGTSSAGTLADGGSASGTTAGTAAGTGGAITTLDEFRAARANRSLYGREVSLSDVVVESLAGDSTFYVQDTDASRGARMLVVLENLGEHVSDPGGQPGSDGRYNVQEGDRIDIVGRVDRFTGSERRVAGANANRLAPDSLYINASRLSATAGTETVRSDERGR
jgi:hypothetical protein